MSKQSPDCFSFLPSARAPRVHRVKNTFRRQLGYICATRAPRDVDWGERSLSFHLAVSNSLAARSIFFVCRESRRKETCPHHTSQSLFAPLAVHAFLCSGCFARIANFLPQATDLANSHKHRSEKKIPTTKFYDFF